MGLRLKLHGAGLDSSFITNQMSFVFWHTNWYIPATVPLSEHPNDSFLLRLSACLSRTVESIGGIENLWAALKNPAKARRTDREKATLRILCIFETQLLYLRFLVTQLNLRRLLPVILHTPSQAALIHNEYFSLKRIECRPWINHSGASCCLIRINIWNGNVHHNRNGLWCLKRYVYITTNK